MVFTDNKELMELAAQINSLLDHHLKAKADYRRSELAFKRMLSNISHDLKTPMTVILGYLEMMRLNGKATQEMLAKTEQKAQSVMELINQEALQRMLLIWFPMCSGMGAMENRLVYFSGKNGKAYG